MKELDASTRRKFLRALTVLGGAGFVSLLTGILRAGETPPDPSTTPPVDPHSQIKRGSETILILIYPGFTAIDAIGPEYILSGMMGATVQFIAKSKDPIKCETGFEVIPELTFAQCPESPTLFLVPGGTAGILEALEDKETMEFIPKVGRESELVGSVCTGSLLLGAAGLLDGYDATSHWQTLDLLPLVGAKPTDKRVVFDRTRITAGGVTAGLDLALELVRHFRGDFYAKGMQLLAQYDPQPPFSGGGSPATADPTVVGLLNEMHKPFVELIGQKLKKSFQQFSPSEKSSESR